MFKATMIAGAGGFIGTCMRFLSEKLGAFCYPALFRWARSWLMFWDVF